MATKPLRKWSQKTMENLVTDAFDEMEREFGTDVIAMVNDVSANVLESGPCLMAEVYVEAAFCLLNNVEDVLEDGVYDEAQDLLYDIQIQTNMDD